MRLFVRNIAWAATDADLHEFFASRGFSVSDAQIIMSGESGRSRGFGFVTISDDENGERALRELDGQDILGRSVQVLRARDKSGGRRSAGRRSEKRSRESSREEFVWES